MQVRDEGGKHGKEEERALRNLEVEGTGFVICSERTKSFP